MWNIWNKQSQLPKAESSSEKKIIDEMKELTQKMIYKYEQ